MIFAYGGYNEEIPRVKISAETTEANFEKIMKESRYMMQKDSG